MSAPMEERIRTVAVRVFAEKGFHRTRMQDIADEAGIAVGSIYNYFRDKDDLLLSIFETEFNARMTFLEDGQRTGLPVIDQVRRLLEQHFAVVQQQPELAQLLLLERFNRGGRLQDRFVALQRGIVERIDGILQSGAAVQDGLHRQGCFFQAAAANWFRDFFLQRRGPLASRGVVPNGATPPPIGVLRVGQELHASSHPLRA